MGIIYIYTFPSGKQYIGQTKSTLAHRTSQHISEAKNNPETGCVVLNKAIIKYNGVFTRDILYTTDDLDDLNFSETECVELHNTLVPNGYNVRSGGLNVPHNPISVAKRGKSLRKHEEDKDLPFFTKRITDNNKTWWRINNHPKCSSKYFDTREDMLLFLADIESGKIPPIIKVPKKEKTTPKFILERKNGYVIYRKRQVLASFLDVNKPKEELLEMAKLRLQELITEGTIIIK